MITCKQNTVAKNNTGQAIIEVALITPLCVLLMLGTIDLLRACYQQQVLNRAARAAVRKAIVEPQLNTSNVPEEVILQEAIRILEVGHIDPQEATIAIKVPGYNYVVGEGDLSTDPIIVQVSLDFQSFLTQILRVSGEHADPFTLFTLQGVAAGFYEDIGTVIDMSILEDEYPEVFEDPDDDDDSDDDDSYTPPPPDRDGDGVRDSWDRFPDDPNEQWDSDRDGVGNNADPDDDNDGLPDGSDPSRYDPDIDDDGIPDGSDDDMDNDGIPNSSDPNPGQYNAPVTEG
ncbi:MAG: pilus assembly protein [Candidatus Omnitrophica bacterium]|nr:pilus assembly protein [Candidatus Omnitrophota bacterium]